MGQEEGMMGQGEGMMGHRGMMDIGGVDDGT